MQLFGYKKMVQYWGAVPPLFGGSGVTSSTMPLGPKSTSVPGGILIRPAIWPQHGGAGFPSDIVVRAEAYLRAKLYLDAFNRLAATRQRYRQTGQTDRQRSDSIGRTLLITLDIAYLQWL